MLQEGVLHTIISYLTFLKSQSNPFHRAGFGATANVKFFKGPSSNPHCSRGSNQEPSLFWESRNGMKDSAFPERLDCKTQILG